MYVITDAVVYKICRLPTEDVVYNFNCSHSTFIVIQSAKVVTNWSCGTDPYALACVKPVDDGGNILNQSITWCNGRQSCGFIVSKSSPCIESSLGNYINVEYKCTTSKLRRYFSQILLVYNDCIRLFSAV